MHYSMDIERNISKRYDHNYLIINYLLNNTMYNKYFAKYTLQKKIKWISSVGV